ncbi:hypothetical protein INT47_013227 [Mucor saturninus]|uniref:Acyl-CoA thioesterase-like C-terminal domain-containing protein n=1 Tax=Mucor saturninus TaxID=64648 RepID=A0A8H7R4H1_9FUNG|nr:hypothetical protein INT47_013227 [Mucor saturninus]
MISQFDEATITSYLGKTERGAHVFTGVASTRWSVGDVPNHQTDPVALNCFFFNKTLGGNYIVEIEELKMSGKGYCVVRAILKQTKDLTALDTVSSYQPSRWIDKVQGVFTMGNMDAEKGVTNLHKHPTPPPLDHLVPYEYIFMGEFVDAKLDTHILPVEDRTNQPELTQVIGFKDGREVDFKSMPYWCDMFLALPWLMGPTFLGGPIWCPTMQLEIQFKKKPTGKKVVGHFLSRHIINGRFDVDGEVWNEQGEILAITRHQNLIVPWSRNVKAKI